MLVVLGADVLAPDRPRAARAAIILVMVQARVKALPITVISSCRMPGSALSK